MQSLRCQRHEVAGCQYVVVELACVLAGGQVDDSSNISTSADPNFRMGELSMHIRRTIMHEFPNNLPLQWQH